MGLCGLSWGSLWNTETSSGSYGGTEISLVQSTPVSVRDLQCCLNLYHLIISFHLLRKSDWQALLAFHFFSSRGEVCYMIHHKKCREENNEILFTACNKWFIHTVMENILNQLRLNTTGSCWGTLFINMICTSIWLLHPASNLHYAVLYQALIGSSVGTLTVYFPLPSKVKQWKIMFLGWYFYPIFIPLRKDYRNNC